MGILRTDKISGLETPTIITGAVDFKGGDTGIGLTSPASADFNFDIYDFTVEWFQYWNSISGFQTLLDINNVNGFLIESGNGTGAYRVYCDNLLEAQESSSNGAVAGRWYHYAVVGDRTNGTIKIYRDGIETGTGNWADDKPAGSATHTLGIGVDVLDEDRNINGYISNLRILKGTALYKSNFTPPTHELEAINDTVLLCCNNSDSVTAASRAGIGSAHILAAKGSVSIASTNPGLTRDFTYGTEFKGVTTFDTQGYFVPPSGTTEQRGGGRGISQGGAPSPSTARSEVIDYITISSMGNSRDFGDLTEARSLNGGCASSTRGICAGGYNEPVSSPGYLNTIDYITIAATGNAVNFGDLTVARNGLSGTSSSTRGVFAGGSKPPSDTKENVIDYLTIASLGDAINFGDLSQLKRNTGCTGSATRAIWAGGQVGPTITNVMDYVTIASTGDATDFGDLTANRRHCIGSSSSTRGIFAGGTTNPTLIDIIEYVTISTLGNSQDFGNLTDARSEFGGPSNKIRAVFMGGWDSPTYDNRIDYITIATTGDASDFGNLGGGVRGAMSGISDSHGGIS